MQLFQASALMVAIAGLPPVEPSAGAPLDVRPPDVGLLSPSRQLQTACPSEDSFLCINGTVDGTSTYCETECDGDCCVGSDACYYFTGLLCKDNVTCIGEKACSNGTIPAVVGGCNGYHACNKLGYNGGSVGGVYNSCLGYKSCGGLGSSRASVGTITDSCQGEYACYDMAYVNGSVGDITSSCNGFYACDKAVSYTGSITDIVDSCVGYLACSRIASSNGTIGGLRGACNNVTACTDAGLGSGIPSGIYYCCNKEDECADATDATLPDACRCEDDGGRFKLIKPNGLKPFGWVGKKVTCLRVKNFVEGGPAAVGERVCGLDVMGGGLVHDKCRETCANYGFSRFPGP